MTTSSIKPSHDEVNKGRGATLQFTTVTLRNSFRCDSSYHDVDDWSANDWATALAGEVGELCNLLKKRRRREEIPDQDIADEMADVFLYLDLLATRCRINLPAAIIDKFNEVSVRVGSGERL